MSINQTRYGELTYKCDSAMRSHYLKKLEVTSDPSLDKLTELERSEIALIDCQDYDILQKKLANWGLRENEIGLMRLRAIEASAAGLKDVVEIHEIRN